MPEVHITDADNNNGIASLAALTAAEQEVMTGLQTYCVLFKLLKSLTVTEIPCKLTKQVLQPVIEHAQDLKYLRLTVASAENNECWALQRWLQQQLPCTTVIITSTVNE